VTGSVRDALASASASASAGADGVGRQDRENCWIADTRVKSDRQQSGELLIPWSVWSGEGRSARERSAIRPSDAALLGDGVIERHTAHKWASTNLKHYNRFSPPVPGCPVPSPQLNSDHGVR